MPSVCHSVFQYFPDYEYARRVLEEFRRVAPVAFILDVPDLATKAESERVRAALGSKPSEHLYYPQSFFDGASIGRSELDGYGNAPFRFNVLHHFRSSTASS